MGFSSDATLLPDGSWLLPYRPPYDWPGILAFLQARAIPGLEIVTGQSYSRIIEIDGTIGSIEVADTPDLTGLRASIRFPKMSALSQIHARLRRMFDLDADPEKIAAVLLRDPRLSPLVDNRPGLRVPGAWDGLEIAIRAILGQQITVRAATLLASKLVATLGRNVSKATTVPGLTHTFPDADRLTAEAVAAVGMPRARAAAIAGLAAAALSDPAFFDPSPDLPTAIRRLCALAGIGDWTAHYIAMRVLREPDAFPAGDIALQRILAMDGRRPTAKALLAHAEQWRPWRAYAVLYVWMSEHWLINDDHNGPREQPATVA